MRMRAECPACLRNLAKLAINLSSKNKKLKEEMRKRAEEIIRKYPPSSVPADVANDFLRMIIEMTGNPDPFRERKIEEMRRAKRIAEKIGKPNDLYASIERAAIGNSLDFFLPISSIEEAVRKRPKFALDGRDELERRIERANEILYIADNAGEVFFDIPLLEFLSEKARVFYAVKEKPIQNDLSLADVEGLDLPVEIIPSSPTVGVYLSLASETFRRKFSSADIIISKGMGNYETLSELDLGPRCFYILRAKCNPVAKSLGVRRGDYVASFLRKV